jgi:hypothetical protein
LRATKALFQALLCVSLALQLRRNIRPCLVARAIPAAGIVKEGVRLTRRPQPLLEHLLGLSFDFCDSLRKIRAEFREAPFKSGICGLHFLDQSILLLELVLQVLDVKAALRAGSLHFLHFRSDRIHAGLQHFILLREDYRIGICLSIVHEGRKDFEASHISEADGTNDRSRLDGRHGLTRVESEWIWRLDGRLGRRLGRLEAIVTGGRPLG